MRWVSVWKRNFKVWQRLIGPFLASRIGEPLVYLFTLGYGLGHYIGDLGGMSYVVFLASGIACSSAMMTATFEGMYGAYTRMSVYQTWVAMISAPLAIHDIIVGEVVWMGTKSLISVLVILIVVASLGLVHSWLALWVLPIVFLVGCCFGAMALVVTSFARSYDFFLYYFTLIITPLMLLSGVFFPLYSMPTGIQWVAKSLPLSHAVELVRPLMTNGSLHHIVLHISVIIFYTLLAMAIAIKLIQRRLLD